MKRTIIQLSFGLGVLAFAAGCQDHLWDDHYGIDGSTETRTLMQVLESRPEYSAFCEVVRSQGLDSLLSTDQTFTVWAPTNEAMAGYVEDVDTKDQFLNNHISRYLYGMVDLADTASVRVRMLNGKSQDYVREGGAYTFAGVSVEATDIAAGNGIIHTLRQRAPFYYNLYESIRQKDNGTDSIARFLTSFDEYTFDEEGSTAIGKNEQGQILYDSIFDFNNDWLRRYGFLHSEDSVYTMIVPTNEGWEDGRRRMARYFRTFGETLKDTVKSLIIPDREYAVGTALADSLSDTYLKQAMCMDLVFRKDLDFGDVPGDSLASTSGNVFHHPSYLLSGATEVPVSNGRIWKTSALKHKPEESWLKTIVVEAENTAGRESNYAVISSRSASSTSFRDSVSEGRFIEVAATSENPRQQPVVQFTVPNTLAAKYNVYCVFAPAGAYMEGVAADSTKVNFYLNYVHEDGRMYEDAVIAGPMPTHGETMTKMFVTQIELPYANYSESPFEGPLTQDDDCVKLRVQANVDRNETTKFTRTMRIDCLIFEPVIE